MIRNLDKKSLIIFSDKAILMEHNFKNAFHVNVYIMKLNVFKVLLHLTVHPLSPTFSLVL